MSHPSVRSLPQFLAFLGTYPDPREVMDTLLHGPLATCGARAVLLWRVQETELVALASVGLSREEAERYSVVPLSLDFKLTRAVTTASVVIDADATSFERSTLDAIDDEFWAGILTRLNVASVVRAPIVHDGAVTGALGIMVDRPWPGDAATTAVLECVTLALGLWLDHPRTGVDGSARHAVRDWTLAFTARQCDILRMVEQGWSNPAIALEMNLSASSVKRDLLRCMRALRCDDRATAAARARSLGLL